MSNQTKILVSSDTFGLFGSVADFLDVWGFMLDQTYFSGIELIGWKGTDKRVEQYKKVGIPVIGIHGRTGGRREGMDLVSKVTLSAINLLFDSIDQLAKSAFGIEYLLFHVGIASKLIKTPNKFISANLILIENDTKPNSTEKARGYINTLKSLNIKADMMFDIVHFLREGSGDINLNRWDSALRVIEETKPAGIHLPIGTHASDSLPLTQISRNSFKELSQVIKASSPKYLVLENQQSRRYSFLLPKHMHKEVRSRNKYLIDTFIDIGLL